MIRRTALCLAVMAVALAAKKPDAKIDPTVYITKTTMVYHREDCTIGAHKLPVYLSEVKKTYKPCKVCKPPKKPIKAEKPPQP